jgi:hypothetical protein
MIDEVQKPSDPKFTPKEGNNRLFPKHSVLFGILDNK